MLEQLRRDPQRQLDDTLAEADKLRQALMALGPARGRTDGEGTPSLRGDTLTPGASDRPAIRARDTDRRASLTDSGRPTCQVAHQERSHATVADGFFR